MPLSKNTAIHMSFLTHMAVSFTLYQFSSPTKLFNSCRLLGLMQTIHASAVSRCLHRITSYFFQNCSCNIFLFAA